MSKIIVAIPCYNEEKTIGKVVSDFKRELPEAEIFVIDNNSTDKSAQIALESGVSVIYEHQQGKGNVVKRIFTDIKADIYVMVDGDDTYPAEEVRKLIEPVIKKEADMVVGNRLEKLDKKSMKLLRNIGNKLITSTLNTLFGSNLKDILSGYRVMSKDFVNNIILYTTGFEIETEITLEALNKNFKICEIPIDYRPRLEGAESKLKPLTDGYKILLTIVSLFRDTRPLTFFLSISFFLLILAIIISIPVINEYSFTHTITRLPSAVLAAFLTILSFLFLVAGFITHTIVRKFQEIYLILRRK